MREPAGIRILVWMCVLIAVNQLGFGSIIPALALYARSFDVTQSAIGARHRDLRARPLPRRGARGPARGPARPPQRAGDRRRPRHGGRQSCSARSRRRYPAFVGARFVAGAGAALVLTTGLIVLADITTPSQPRAHDVGLPGRVPLRGRHRAAARRRSSPTHCGPRGALPGLRGRRRRGRRRSAWLAHPRDARGPARRRAASRPHVPSFAPQLRLLTAHRGLHAGEPASAFVNAVARTGALFNVDPDPGAGPARARTRTASASAWPWRASSASPWPIPPGVLVDRYGRKIVIVPATHPVGPLAGALPARADLRAGSSPRCVGVEHGRRRSAAPRPPPTRPTPRRPA